MGYGEEPIKAKTKKTHGSYSYHYPIIILLGSVALYTGFTNGAGQIWLDDVACRGTERRLIDCTARPLGSHNCGHIEDVGVRCSSTTSAYGMVYTLFISQYVTL